MWYLGSTRIFVTGQAGQDAQTIARLQPLSGGTILQTFGYESEIVKVSAKVVGDTDLDALKAMASSGLYYTLSGWGETYGPYLVKNVNWTRNNIICQTLKTPSTDPMYDVEFELYE